MSLLNFNNINWGQDESKGDIDLVEYFVPFPEFDLIKNGKIRYVIGRKGTGKTAVIERIRLEAEKDPLSFYSILTLRDFPLNDLRSFRDKSYRDKSQFVSIWLFLIYIEIAKLIIKDNGIKSQGTANELERFLVINNLINGVGFVGTVDLLKSTSAKVKILPRWLGVQYGNDNSSKMEVQVHYQKVVNIIRDLIVGLDSESQFWMFMDELDEGFRAGDSGLRLLLLSLLRAVEDSSLALKRSCINYRPLLVLRSDIFDRLEDNDLNKLDDYLIRLKWSSKEDYSEYALKNIPNARIKVGLNIYDTHNPWDVVVKNDDPTLPERVNTVWQYMANRTYERPRDIIKFLKYCRKENRNGKLSFKAVLRAENDYSNWLYNELRDEIHSYLPVWKESLQCISKIGCGKFDLDEFLNQLKNNIVIKRWMDENSKYPEEIVEILFDFGILGNLDDKRWIFKYKDDDLSWNSNMDLIVHYGLQRKLRIFKY